MTFRVALKHAPRRLVLVLIRGYQLTLSPFIGNQCRFHPTCSRYAGEAIERFGVLRGGWLALRRLGRCHPFHPCGVDPVPAGTAPAREET
ncbi:MAG: membrane protein insertion efficiency factor YidD [Pseudomonadales bacterium]